MGTLYQAVLLFACVSAFADHLETSPRLAALFGRNLGPYPLRQELFRRAARPWVVALMTFHASAALLFLAFGDWQRSTGPAFYYLANSFLLFFLIPAGMLWQSRTGSPVFPVFGRRSDWYRRVGPAMASLFQPYVNHPDLPPHPNPLPHGEGTSLLSQIRSRLTGKPAPDRPTDGKVTDQRGKPVPGAPLSPGKGKAPGSGTSHEGPLDVYGKPVPAPSLSSGRGAGVRGGEGARGERVQVNRAAQATGLFAALLAVPVVLTVVLILIFPLRAGARVQEVLGPAGRSALSNWLFVAYMLVSAAIAEEFIFRHYLFNRLAALRKGAAGLWAAAIITSLVFCLGHGAMLSPEWLKFVQIFVLGVSLCICQVKLGTEACIALHLAFNFSMILVVAVAGME